MKILYPVRREKGNIIMKKKMNVICAFPRTWGDDIRDMGLVHMAASYSHIFTAAYFTASDDDGCTCYPISSFEIPETAWRIPAPRPWMYAAWKIQSGRIFALDFRGEQPFSFEQECSNRPLDRRAA